MTSGIALADRILLELSANGRGMIACANLLEEPGVAQLSGAPLRAAVTG
jgi:hypothetical protein